MDVGKASRLGLYRKTRERKRDRKVFSRTAGKTRKENFGLRNAVMRGGGRL